METWKTLRFSGLLLVAIFFSVLNSSAQCPTFYDFNGTPVENPYWYSCNGGNFTLTLQSPAAIGAWEVNWGDGSPVQSGASLVPPASVTHLYTAAVDTFVVTFTEIATGCEVQGVVVMEEATSASIQIPVGGLTQACAPQVMDFINSSTNVSETTVFTWDFGDGSPPLVFDHTNWNQTISHLYEQGTVDCETVVTLTAENYCNTIQGGHSQATFNPIRIWDLDDAAITPSNFVQCYPDTVFTFLNTTERNCLFQGNIFQRQEYWDFGDYWGTGQDSIIDWTPWPPTFPKTIAYPGIGSYEIMMIDSNYCGQDTAVITVHIVEPAEAAFTASEDTICAGQSVVFVNQSSPNANSFSWHFGTNPWINTGSGNITRTYNTPGTYLVQLVATIDGAAGSCADTATYPIVVLPAPTPIINVDNPAACDELTVQFSSGTTGNITSWEWVLPEGQLSSLPTPPAMTLTTPGAHLATLTVTSVNGCSNTDHTEVFVYQTPQVGFLPENVCVGVPATFIDMSVSAPGDSIVSWNWDINGDTVLTGPVVSPIFNAIGTYDITLEVATPHCAASEEFEIVVEPVPEAAFSASVIEGCGPLTVEFTNQSQGAFSYTWIFGDGALSNDESPVHTFLNFTQEDIEFEVELVASTEFGCTDTASVTITVYPGAVAQFTANSLPGCAPFDAEFFNNSQGAIGYQWDFGDGSPFSDEDNPVHTYQNQGLFVENFLVELVAFASSGCHDTAYATVTAYPEPNFSFNTLPDSGCSPLSVQFPNILGAIQLDWNFGDGNMATGQSPAHTYHNNTNAPINFEAQLIATSPFGCIDTAYSAVLVNPAPISQFTADVESGCGPLDVSFNNLSQNAHTFTWNFGDGTVVSTEDPVVEHTFHNTGTALTNFTVSLSAQTNDGCSHTSEMVVQVYPDVIAAFEMPEGVCAQTAVAFNNQSVGGNTFSWDFGNGFVDFNQSPEHIFNGVPGDSITYEVSLEVASGFGCVSSTSQQITIHPLPVAAMSLSTLNGCGPLEVEFENESQFADEFHWNYGDGNTSSVLDSSHAHTFSNSGFAIANYEIQLTATNYFGCQAVVSQQVNVFPEVTAGFNPIETACAPLNAQFENTSIGASSFIWDFGNGFIGNTESPSHTYQNNSGAPVTHDVVLTAQNGFGCSDTFEGSVTVNPQPTAMVQPGSLTGCGPFEMELTNLSENADFFAWNYGNGATSEVADSVHTHVYENGGMSPATFALSLTASNQFGCSAQWSQEVTVFPEVTAAFTTGEGGCTPYQTGFQNNSQGATSFTWDFGDGNMGSGQSPNYVFHNNGTEVAEYTVVLTALNSFGCSANDEQVVTVYPLPQVQFDITEVSNCAPFEVTFQNQSTGVETYSWDYGNGETSSESAFEHTQVFENQTGQSLTFNVNLQGVSEFGCSNQSTLPVNILPELVALFSVDTIDCSPLQATFFNQSVGGATYNWFANGEWFSDQNNPIHTFHNFSNQTMYYNVMLVAQSFTGCLDSISQTLTVLPQPQASFEVTPGQQTFPDATFSVTNTSDAEQSVYFWEWGDGNTSFGENPDPHTYGAWGTFTITLTADNGMCADQFTQEVIIDVPLPAANFSGENSGCQPITVQFVNESEFGVQYYWEFGDGAASAAENPTHTYFQPGTYTVTLTVTGYNGETDVMVKQDIIEVYPQAIAFFAANPLNVVIPNNPVNFFNLSQNATDYLWDFGDGNYSTEENPQYMYGEVGSYWVTLIATNEYLCADTFRLANPIVAEGAGSIVFPNAFTPSPAGSTGGYYDLSDNLYNNDIFFPLTEGVEEYQLMIYNRWGEMIFESREVNRGWDGYFKDRLCKQDVYVWKVRARFSDGRQIQQAGDVTLIR